MKNNSPEFTARASFDTDYLAAGLEMTVPWTYPDSSTSSGSRSSLSLHQSLYWGWELERRRGETRRSPVQHLTPPTWWKRSSSRLTCVGSGEVSGRNQSYQRVARGEEQPSSLGQRYPWPW